jgi:hypothetical protein
VFPLYATSAVDTDCKFSAGIVDTGAVANLSPVSTTQAELVANLLPMLLILVENLLPVLLIPAAILPPCH